MADGAIGCIKKKSKVELTDVIMPYTLRRVVYKPRMFSSVKPTQCLACCSCNAIRHHLGILSLDLGAVILDVVYIANVLVGVTGAGHALDGVFFVSNGVSFAQKERRPSLDFAVVLSPQLM